MVSLRRSNKLYNQQDADYLNSTIDRNSPNINPNSYPTSTITWQELQIRYAPELSRSFRLYEKTMNKLSKEGNHLTFLYKASQHKLVPRDVMVKSTPCHDLSSRQKLPNEPVERLQEKWEYLNSTYDGNSPNINSNSYPSSTITWQEYVKVWCKNESIVICETVFKS